MFPTLETGDIDYERRQPLGGADAIGPMLVRVDEPVHVVQRGDEVNDLVTPDAVAV